MNEYYMIIKTISGEDESIRTDFKYKVGDIVAYNDNSLCRCMYITQESNDIGGMTTKYHFTEGKVKYDFFW